MVISLTHAIKTKKKKMKTNIKIGQIYNFQNISGYRFTMKVTRITEKSIFVQSLCKINNQWLPEHREGINTFNKYINTMLLNIE